MNKMVVTVDPSAQGSHVKPVITRVMLNGQIVNLVSSVKFEPIFTGSKTQRITLTFECDDIEVLEQPQ